ncbi:MAG: SusC/RagA family TonB-linked outer membrane protein [Sphingobacteriales bacterium]|nr:SusC/RagA family TonB-linked outer membrane protein [Sphingobacteriales bacterium]OJY86766.1 MAG: hypothetical protein BGP14_18135 [Sphingobacteriales bacterium 44-15]
MKRNFLAIFLPFLLFLLAGIEVAAQNTLVKGVVKDAADQPLEGVTILEKGTKNGTISNLNGTYSLAVKPNAILVFSFSGFKEKEVKAGKGSLVNVSLEADDKQLSEVVVTALGIQRNKKSLAYSTQTVEGSKLAEVREVNVANSLKGKVAGVHVNPSGGGPSGSSYVVIRGSSSLTGTNQPLYVVDGVPIDNQTLGRPSIFGGQRDFGDGVGNINPDDIENVTVLKGPAAAALYGSRGAKGVILITTKKGKSGRLNVDINSNVTFEKVNVTPTFQSIYGGGYDDNYTSFDNAVIDGQNVSQWPSWLQDNWGGKYDGRLISIAAWPELGLIPYVARGDDNFKKFYRTGSTATNTAGVSGGSENATFRLSLSDMRNTGIVPNNSMNRQTVNMLASFRVSPKLSVEAKVNYVRQHTVNPPETGGGGTSATVALNRMPLFLDLDWLKDYKREDGSAINYKSGTPRNPYWIMNEMLADGRRDRVIGYVLARYKFTDWLTLQARSGTDFYNDTRFSRIGVGTPGIVDGSVNNTEYNIKEENSDVLLTASGNLSKNFTGSFSVGANHLNRRTNSLSTDGTGFNIPGLYNIGNAKRITSSSYPTQKQINSAYFDGQLGYKNYLFLNITGRNDWSSTLGIHNYSFFYPSTNLSFVFTDALNLNSSVLSYGKLRASYAQAGADADVYRTKSGYVLSSSSFNGQPYAYVSDEIPLADLKNELTRSYEFGTELRFFKNRLGLDFTYYNASTINQILPVQISVATGFVTRVINAGEIRNKGVELFVNAAPVVTKDFRWDLTLNFSKNKSKVVSLADGIETLTLLDTYNGAVIEARVGESYGNIVGLPFLRNENGDRVLTEQGAWQRGNEPVVFGNVQPDWLGGITNTFNYKGIQLSVLVDVRQGGQVYSMSKYNQMAGGTGKFTENRDNLIADGVIQQPDGKYVKSDKVLLAQDYYALQGPWTDIGETCVIDADYVALREASISYNLGQASLLKKSILKSAKISVVARNLFYLYRDPQFKTMGISPETAFNTTTAAQGVEMLSVPTTRSLGFNLSFTF